MLWAFLLASTFPRDDYLGCFREIVSWMRATFPPPDQSADATSKAAPQSRGTINDACEIDHTSLAELSDYHFEQFIKIPLSQPLGYGALRPLLLLDSLPGIHRWRAKLGVEPTKHDWQTLVEAVIATLDHQSERSTDVRWMKLVLKIVLEKFLFAQETAEEIFAFPNKGDMRKVRPSIRAAEMSLRRNPPSAWIEKYWAELMTKTPCIDGSSETDYFKLAAPTLTRDAILSARHQLAQRFRTVMSSNELGTFLEACLRRSL